MKTWFKLLLAVFFLLSISLIAWWGLRKSPVTPEEPTLVATTTPEASLEVMSLQENALISSPLTVTGRARGMWYFEGSFPVRVLDAEGVELGVVAAQAQGEWMTTEFVPFSATLTFATSTTAAGTIVFEKDNPSGLPEYAAEVRIPIRFK